jgi:hypothetical protein
VSRRAIEGQALLELAEQVVGRRGFLDVVVHGPSMSPAIADGDEVRLGPVQGGVGAIVLAVVDGQPCLHRVAARRDGQTLLRAESCQREDWVPDQAMVAEVRQVMPRRLRSLPRLRARLAGMKRFWSALALAVGLLAAQQARAQCTVTPYIVVDGQSCDWTASEKPLVIAGSGAAGQLVLSQTQVTDAYNTTSTGNGSLFGLMTFAAGTTFAVNDQVGLFLNIPGGPAVDAACGANASVSFSCTAAPCSSAANWVGGVFLGLSGTSCQNATSGTLLTLSGTGQNAAFAVNGTTIEFGVTFAALGVSTSFSVRPYTTTNYTTNANLNMSAQTAYNALTVGPLAVRVSSLAARLEAGGVTVGWLTHAEAGNLGFHVWRRRGGAWSRLSQELVPGALSSFGVREYRFRDRDGRAGDEYAVTDVDRYAVGQREWGTVRASPTAALPVDGSLPRRPAVRTVVGPVRPAAQTLRLGVSHEGIYRIDPTTLTTLGGAIGRTPALTRSGSPVGVQATNGGWLFYAPPVQNTYDGVDAYLLELAPVASASPLHRPPNARGAPLDTAVQAHEHFKQYKAYDWFTGGDDPYYWTWSSNLFPVDPAVFDAPGVLRGAGSNVSLRLVGGTADAHHVQIQLNGVTLGELKWIGPGEQLFQATVRPGTLLPHGNALSVVTVFDTGVPYEFVLLDWLDVAYERAPMAVDGEARFELPSGHCTKLSGFGQDAAAWDVTDPLRPAAHGADASGNLFACSPSDGHVHRFEVFDPSVASAPSVRPAERLDLGDRSLQSDEVIIVHPSLRAAVDPLVLAREAQGLRVKVVSLTQVYDSFGFGNEGREPLRQFLRTAHERWRTPPRYVLLVGGANADVRDAMATGVPNLIPSGAVLAGPHVMRAASDSWFVAGNDGVTPWAAIGRLAVDTPSDAVSVISKVLGADVQGSPTGSALLAADISVMPSDADFAGASQIVGDRLSHAGVQPVQLSGGAPGAAATVASVLGQGVDLWHYVGHAGTSVWGQQQWLSAAQVSVLQNRRLPLLTSFDCLDGMFDNPTTTSLGWVAVSNPLGGAMGSFVPSTVMDPREGHAFDLMVTQALAAPPGRGRRVGDALLWAQQQAALQEPLQDFVRAYNLLGDPASLNPLVH